MPKLDLVLLNCTCGCGYSYVLSAKIDGVEVPEDSLAITDRFGDYSNINEGDRMDDPIYCPNCHKSNSIHGPIEPQGSTGTSYFCSRCGTEFCEQPAQAGI